MASHQLRGADSVRLQTILERHADIIRTVHHATGRSLVQFIDEGLWHPDLEGFVELILSIEFHCVALRIQCANLARIALAAVHQLCEN
jgi:hypothetical protein